MDRPRHGYDRNASHNAGRYVCDCGSNESDECDMADYQWMDWAETKISTFTTRIAELEAECERLKTLGSDYDLEELLRIYTALHDGKVTAHWLWVAIERIGAGESVTECLEDYGYIPEQRAAQLQAKLDAVAGLPKYELHTNPYTPDLDEVDSEVGDWIKLSELQQALNAHETA